MKKTDELPDCCKPKTDTEIEESSGFWAGILYGILPHTFCILFVVLSVIGATTGAVFLKKFIFVPNLFVYLVILSFFFATLSAFFYLKKNRYLSIAGMKKKWKYLTILFLTTIIVNVGLIYFIIPAAANVKKNNTTTPPPATAPSENVQTIEMDQLGGGYKPNQFTIKKNVPVRWVINSKSPYACSATIYSKKLGINQDLKPGINIIEFTPKETGEISFSCLMGMYSGKFIVVN